LTISNLMLNLPTYFICVFSTFPIFPCNNLCLPFNFSLYFSRLLITPFVLHSRNFRH
jgi:hypothetical protein